MSHSPTPYVHNGNGLIYGQCSGDDGEAPFVADIIADRERAAFGMMTDQEAATAAFIVTACNAHLLLLATLDDLIGDRPDIQSGICVACGRDYRHEPSLEGANCPSADCPRANARRVNHRATFARPFSLTLGISVVCDKPGYKSAIWRDRHVSVRIFRDLRRVASPRQHAAAEPKAAGCNRVDRGR